MGTGEFELIQAYFAEPFAALQSRHPEVLRGIGADAALVASVPGHDWVISVDSYVESVHFPAATAPQQIADFVLAAALSDLAASGARPVWFTLSLSMPDSDDDWLTAFSQHLYRQSVSCGCVLIGGDTVRGPLLLTLQVAGLVPRGKALGRCGAGAGDDLYVSGTLGGAALCLRETNVLQVPQPRLALGIALRDVASACIDISDGLYADLGHLAHASGLGAEIDWSLVPCAKAVRGRDDGPQLALCGGDDYELCFAVAPTQTGVVDALSERLSLSLTRIGRMYEGQGVEVVGLAESQLPSPVGFRHF